MAKKALLVGINKHNIPDANLNGCVNDVTNVRDILLSYFGFNASDVRVLVKWLVNKATDGDSLLFHYSGHGSQVTDRDGDELKDKMDEILCPHDMDWDGNFIPDDDLGKLFENLPNGVNLEVLLDCCHSGTGTREMQAIRSLPTELSFKATSKNHFLKNISIKK
jgi:uncharacterized caspase-like protein